MIRYTEILKFHLQYNTFPSEYVRDCIVTPLPNNSSEDILIPEDNSLDLVSADENIAKSSRGNCFKRSAKARFLPKESSEHSIINQICSGKVFKLQKIKQKTLGNKYPGRTNRHLNKIRDLLQKNRLIVYRLPRI